MAVAETTGHGKRSDNSRINVLLCAPPPQTIASEGDPGKCGRTLATLAAVKAVSVAAASSVAEPIDENAREIVPVERFWRREGEKRMGEKFAQDRSVDFPFVGSGPFPIERHSEPLEHKIVKQGISRTRVARDRRLAGRYITEIGDTADIDHRDGFGKPGHRRERAVEDGNKRRSLPSLRDIGGTKIMDNFDAQSFGEHRAIADLNGEAPLRPVQNRLAMKADQIDLPTVDVLGAEKAFNRTHMTVRDHGICARQGAGSRLPIVK